MRAKSVTLNLCWWIQQRSRSSLSNQRRSKLPTERSMISSPSGWKGKDTALVN